MTDYLGERHLPTIQCATCGRVEAMADVAWIPVYIAAGPCEVHVDVCPDCQRTGKLTEEKLIRMVEAYVREKLRFYVADAMMREPLEH